MRSFLKPLQFLVGLMLSSLALAQNAPRPPIPGFERKATTPNIILIVADDLGYGDLGCYGQTRIRTPNLDRVAAEGMQFMQTYAGNTVCIPSRCALMTGLHSGHGQLRSNEEKPLLADTVTLARVAQAAGYSTCALGKWALGAPGTSGAAARQGFDEWYGYPDQLSAHNYYPAELWRNDEATPRVILGNVNGKTQSYAPDLFVKAANNFIKIHQYDPFFLYLATTIPHANNELGTNGMQVPGLGAYRREAWPPAEQAKAAMITRFDDHVGQIFTELERRNLDRDTLVIITSDNGPHSEGGVQSDFHRSSGRLRGQKRDLYEGGIRVPFIVRWPGHIKPGSTNGLPLALWDILPTVAELIGISPPPTIDGLSFAPVLFGKEPLRQHEFLYWEFHERGYQRAARMGPWKCVQLGLQKPMELYHLESDPGESRNVAADHPEIVEKFTTYFRTAAHPYPEQSP
jgi:arylsulfatase A-like enzyme